MPDLETCTKCGTTIAYNERTQLWEDEDVIICKLGPYPWKHVPPYSSRVENKPSPKKSGYDDIIYSGYGFLG